ncbi:MAG: hypothetical protein KC591_12315 [Gemmatimonadetes bacterium]|nr:hypothetical protein [Gemmatimonadota bacterium]
MSPNRRRVLLAGSLVLLAATSALIPPVHAADPVLESSPDSAAATSIDEPGREERASQSVADSSSPAPLPQSHPAPIDPAASPDPSPSASPSVTTQPILAAAVHGTWPRLGVILAALLVTWFGTNWLVPLIAGAPRRDPAIAESTDPVAVEREAERARLVKRQGMILGKCENVLTVIFVVSGQPVGLALIFTAKTLARQQEIREDAGYYLGGTLVNFTISLVVASVARVLIAGL